MHHLPRLVLLAAVLSLPLASCGEAPSEPPPAVPVDPHEALVAELKAAGSTPTPPSNITLLASTDLWIVALPEGLTSKWASLGLKVPQPDKDRLLKEAAMSPNVVVARVTEGRIAEVSTLPEGFSTSPEAFSVKGGESLSLTRAEAGKPVVIQKPKS